MRVSAGEARRQLSAPEKAASPRQDQDGKAVTSLQHGKGVSTKPCPYSPPGSLSQTHLKAEPHSCSTACTTSSFSSWCREQVE